MVADADGDAQRVEVLAGVMGVHAVDVEGPQPDALDPGGVAEQADAGDLREARAHALASMPSWAWMRSRPMPSR
jgi:hypothetical protein